MGHISALYIFAKETDAVETARGFKFQELKTLEAWLQNKNAGSQEVIYCDYEEDIFQRNLAVFKTTFKQLKLYSSKNFSFASVEIKKAIAHFFMLFVKGDYLFDEIQFVFETNTSIAAKKGDNDAHLLKEWAEGQESLDGVLLAKSVGKLKQILDAYVSEQYNDLEKEADENLGAIKSVYDQLPIQTWENFARSIRWNFAGISTEQALNGCIDAIKNSIAELSFPITKDQQDIVFDKLRGIVSDRSMAIDPQQRMLSNDLLTQALLDLGSHDDVAYNQDYETWKDAEKISDFKTGEFYQVMHASRHCRRNKYLEEHAPMWKMLLWEYFKNAQTPCEEKREVICELVWSTLRPYAGEKPVNSLKGLEHLIDEYFSNFEQYKNPHAVEDALNLINTAVGATILGLLSLDEAKIEEWYSRFESFLTDLKELFKYRKQDLLRILEIESFFFLNRNNFGYGDEDENLGKVKVNFDMIIRLLPEAPLFSVSQLGERVSSALHIYFNARMEARETAIFEEFSEALEPFVLTRNRDKDTAKGYIIKGDEYLKSINPKGLLKALSYFHKAKNLYLNDDYAQGYILSLINISQFYSAVGMHIAAKHYALAVIWYCKKSSDPALYKRISDAYGLLFLFEFKQGSWINALQNFETAAGYRTELDPSPFDSDGIEALMKKLASISYILAAAPKISPQLFGFIEYEKLKMNPFYSETLSDFVEVAASHITDNDALLSITEDRLDSPAINDIGEFRTLSWKIFGSIWRVTFRNDFVSNSIGEEFCSLIQVFLTDIAVYELDFLLLKDQVNIEIELSDAPKEPEQIADNSNYSWKVYLQIIDSNKSGTVNLHYALISTMLKVILAELSLLPTEDFRELYKAIMSRDLASKALLLNSYQQMYRNEFSEQKFDDSRRNHFKSEYLATKHFQAPPFRCIDKTSSLYSKEQSTEHIKNRYSNFLGKIKMTFDRIKDLPEFVCRVNELRAEGWLDWQILMALMNTVFNHKAYYEIAVLNRRYSSEQEQRLHFEQIIGRFYKEGETAANYIDIPIEILLGGNLEMHLEQSGFYALESFGLRNRSRFPNYKAIRKMLNSRFNYDIDDSPADSPFKF